MSTKNEEKVLFDNDHMCCICHEKGKRVQTHHINGDSSNDNPSNIAILCLEHHSDATGSQGFGRKYGEGEIKHYKDDWEGIIKKRRAVEGNPLIPLLLADLKEKSINTVKLSDRDMPLAEKKASQIIESLHIIEPLYPVLVREIENTIEHDKESWKTEASKGKYLTSGTLASTTASNFISKVSGQKDSYPKDLDIPSTSIATRFGFQPELQYYDLVPLNNLYWAKTFGLPKRVPLCPSCLSKKQYSLVTREDRWASGELRDDGLIAYQCPTCKSYWQLTPAQEQQGENY
jgi:hypothetical protein